MAYPETVIFERIKDGHDHKCFYTLGIRRKPRLGEYYLSGAPVQAYKAYHDLDDVFQVVTPTYLAVPATRVVKGDPV